MLRKFKKQIFSAMLSAFMLGQNSISFALPVNPHDMTNINDIATAENVMNITGEGNALIKWEDFSVNANETVNFSGMDKALNFVDGLGNPSRIMGNINAPNIDLFIMNPSGVLFGKNSSVNAGALHASTNLLTDEMQEQYLTSGTNPLNSITNAEDLMGDVAFLNDIQADKLVVRGRNISILHTDKINATETDLRVPENGHIDTPTGEDISNIGGKYLDGSTNANINRNDFTVLTSEAELKNLSPTGHYMLDGSDLTLSDSWTGIKDTTDNAITFSGVLNGMGTTISGLNGSEGFFSKDSTLNGELRNFDFKDNSPTLDHAFIVDKVKNATIGNIRNISDENLIFNNDTHFYTNRRPYGLFGGVEQEGYLNIYSVANNMNIIGNSTWVLGGILGTINSGANAFISNIHNKGQISINKDVDNMPFAGHGGLVGKIDSYSSTTNNIIRHSSNSGAIFGKTFVGGIVGQVSQNENSSITLNDVNNEGAITSDGTQSGGIGGLIGEIFQGTLNHNKISNNGLITGVDNSSVGGLFGKIELSSSLSLNEISNGKLYNSSDINGANNVGGLIGEINNTNLYINDIHNKNDITGNNNIGGLIGIVNHKVNDNPKNLFLNNVSNLGDIRGLSFLGGLIGNIANGLNKFEAKNTYNTGSIISSATSSSFSSASCLGGLVGAMGAATWYGGDSYNKYFMRDVKFINSYNEGNISSKFSNVGGITGRIKFAKSEDNLILNNVYNKGNIASDGGYTGGLVGDIIGGTFDVNNIYNSGSIYIDPSISHNSYTGGIFGAVSDSIFSLNEETNGKPFNTVNVNGSNNYVGGLIGSIGGQSKCVLENINNTNEVIGKNRVGGIIGGVTDNANVTINNSRNSANIQSNRPQIGGIIGYISGASVSKRPSVKLDNVYNAGNITSSDYGTGGLIGYASYGDLIFNNVFNKGVIKGKNDTGGLIGYNIYTPLEFKGKCYNEGDITGSNATGGLIGYIASSPKLSINNTHNSNKITGSNGVGGIIGQINNTEIEMDNVNNTNSIIGSQYTGGIIGQITSSSSTSPASSISLNHTYNIGDIKISNNSSLGGLIGYAKVNNLAINQSFNSGNFIDSSAATAGGLVGEAITTNGLIVKDSYNNGTVKGNYGGGIIGTVSSDVTMTNVYNAGDISAIYRGGLIYNNTDSKTITLNNTHYRNKNSGKWGSNITTPILYGKMIDYNATECIANTIDELKTPTTYNGFDLDISGESNQDKIWRIYEGNTTPYLTTFMTPVEVDVASMTTKINYDGEEHTASISDLLTTAKSQVTEPEHIFGNDVKGTEIGIYKSQLYSDQLGYNFKFKAESEGKENNTIYLVIRDGSIPEPIPTPTPTPIPIITPTEEETTETEPTDTETTDSESTQTTPTEVVPEKSSTDETSEKPISTEPISDETIPEEETPTEIKPVDTVPKEITPTTDTAPIEDNVKPTAEPLQYDVEKEVFQPVEFPFQKGNYTDLDSHFHLLHASDDVSDIEEDYDETEEDNMQKVA